ncbi:DUF6791 domain-containing protein [Rhizobium sp. 32-5/1]|uniref:DUF6791 domain-containing protein n=1 Tax=Rhizobium sp. 32-5/1 TaxID=3019602 RepID=UPI0032B72783
MGWSSMSADLINRDPHLKRLQDEGFELEMRDLVLIVHSVPYVKRDMLLGRGSSFAPFRWMLKVLPLSRRQTTPCGFPKRCHAIAMARR